MLEFGKLVSDWGGFEKLIEEIHKCDGFHVKRDITLIGTSGAPRQIDVFITHKKGPYDYSTIIECKYWNSRVGRDEVDKVYASMQDLNASSGVVFTTKGFQSGAITYAKSKGIHLFNIRDLTPEEWGLPGRRFQMHLQVISRSVRNLKIVANSPADLHISLGSSNQSRTEYLLANEDKPIILEEKINAALDHAISVFGEKRALFNSGSEGTYYAVMPVNMPFEKPAIIHKEKGPIHLFKVQFEACIKIEQSSIEHDRGQHFDYSLIVEDAVNNMKQYVYRKSDNANSEWSKVDDKKNEEKNHDDIYKNGSLAFVVTKYWFNAAEIDSMKSVSV